MSHSAQIGLVRTKDDKKWNELYLKDLEDLEVSAV